MKWQLPLVSHQVRQGRFAHSRGAPEQQGRNLTGSRYFLKDFSRTQKMFLADDLFQG